MRVIFPEGSINATYRRGRNLKELFYSSPFPQPQLVTKSNSIVNKYGKKCDTCDYI